VLAQGQKTTTVIFYGIYQGISSFLENKWARKLGINWFRFDAEKPA
jgi:hypothetical protein